MLKGGLLFLVVLLGLGVMLVSNVFFIVPETQQALVLQFGQPKNQMRDAGLYMKTPFVQNVLYFDKRILNASGESLEAPDSERRRLLVDAFVRYRIIDALKFYQTLVTPENGRQRMLTLLSSSLRNEIGKTTIFTVLSEERGVVMQNIQDAVNSSASEFGIEVVDVRIRRADLPQQNINSILDRMVSEREREAQEARAEGQEIKNRIESQADREREVILAEAHRDSEIIRGDGDGERNKIYADSYGKDPEFFAFYRAMVAYERALGSNDTTMIIAPDSEFFKYLGSDLGR